MQVTRRHAGQPGAAAMEIGIGINDLVRHHAGLQDLLAAIDIAQEKIPRPHALAQAGLDARPFVAADDQRHQVKSAAGAGIRLGHLAGSDVGSVLLAQFVRHRENAVKLLQRKRAERLLDLPRDADGAPLRSETLGLRLGGHRLTVGRWVCRGGHALRSCLTPRFHARGYAGRHPGFNFAFHHLASESRPLSTFSFACSASAEALSIPIFASFCTVSAAGIR